jgi:hypothetical protein
VRVRFELASPDRPEIVDAVIVSGVPAEILQRLARAGSSDAEWSRRLPVQVGESPGDQPTVLGDYSVVGDAVRFEPRFPFAAGEVYHARWIDGASGREVASARVRREAPASGEPARVIAVYPSTDALPENTLRIYVHFSRPMSRGEAAAHVRLIGPAGEVEQPFVALEHELWNGARDRLTLLLDPGRLKRGVGPNVEMGPVLTRGGSHRLEVAAGWRDGGGRPTAEPFVKSFEVVGADRERPRPGSWSLVPPREPLGPVELRFGESLDRGLLQHAIRVEDPRGRAIEGRVSVGLGERSWSFRPAQPWPSTPCRLVVDATLEDPSGNRIGRLFEEPLRGSVGEEPAPAVALEFSAPPR